MQRVKPLPYRVEIRRASGSLVHWFEFERPGAAVRHFGTLLEVETERTGMRLATWIALFDRRKSPKGRRMMTAAWDGKQWVLATHT
jgi:hypothetical protein